MKKLIIFASLALVPFTASASDGFNFSAYTVDKVYTGKPHAPKFVGNNERLSSFKTRIKDAMAGGSVFAGEFSVAQFGCGTGCTSVIVANNRTGDLYSFPRGGESNQALTLAFTAKSNLMVARWYTDSLWETCVFESFLFDDGKWIAKAAIASKGDEICSADVAQGAKKAGDN
ncbi:hypothetical protein OIU34_00070 [Pararhizobium sp. BT-229]|uniref:hypothetical protein n=1 Tax=Pararhizobium sp. BT-229 TaxID=2986923 RepID=UPI0021F6EBBC|nr:hypothetical protein [Pararhizobium sp. BT-229]MCV9960283.1 hypothetical protein [Pararhizobium sp. BT-229]